MATEALLAHMPMFIRTHTTFWIHVTGINGFLLAKVASANT